MNFKSLPLLTRIVGFLQGSGQSNEQREIVGTAKPKPALSLLESRWRGRIDKRTMSVPCKAKVLPQNHTINSRLFSKIILPRKTCFPIVSELPLTQSLC